MTLRVMHMNSRGPPHRPRGVAIDAIPAVAEVTLSTDNGTASVALDGAASNSIELAEAVVHADHPAWSVGQWR